MGDPSESERSTPDERRRPDVVSKIVLPVVVAVLGALLITTLTPLGETVRDALFPTRAAVTGSVVMSDQPAAGARLELDGTAVGATNTNGEFLLTDVGRGAHRLRIETAAALPRDLDFAVESRQPKLQLEPIDLQPRFRLGYVVSLDTPRSASDRVAYDITVWVDGGAADLAAVQAVSYVLPPPLPAEPVTGGAAQQGYCYRQVGAVDFDDLMTTGTSSTATAKIDLQDGTSIAVSWQGDPVPQPVDCPPVDMGSGGDGSSGNGSGSGGGGGGGEQTVPVPPVVGLQLADAEQLLRAAGLAVGESQQQQSDEPAGTVLETTPAPGSQLPRGAVVALTVSAGPGQATVPDVVGLDTTDAIAVLAEAGFESSVEVVQSSTDKSGVVLKQDPPAEDEAPSGSTVVIVVAGDDASTGSP